ncbi:MAG: 30S ribosomal protein S6e [Candidatus Aenigmatarchaeota archaeon]
MFKIIISDPEEGQAWQVEKEATPLIGTRIGEEFNGSFIGLEGYTLELTGGSDKEGFPMRKGTVGTGRRKVLMKEGAGYNPKENGIKRRKSVRGDTVSEGIVQVNTKIVDRENDVAPVPELLGLAEEEQEEEEE